MARTAKVDSGGKVTLGHGSQLFHIGIGRSNERTWIRLCIAGLDVRIVTTEGTRLRYFTLTPRGLTSQASLAVMSVVGVGADR
jgi:hypothetical protein